MIEKVVRIIMQMPDSVSEQKDDTQLSEAIDAVVVKIHSINEKYLSEFGEGLVAMSGNSGVTQQIVLQRGAAENTRVVWVLNQLTEVLKESGFEVESADEYVYEGEKEPRLTASYKLERDLWFREAVAVANRAV